MIALHKQGQITKVKHLVLMQSISLTESLTMKSMKIYFYIEQHHAFKFGFWIQLVVTECKFFLSLWSDQQYLAQSTASAGSEDSDESADSMFSMSEEDERTGAEGWKMLELL